MIVLETERLALRLVTVPVFYGHAVNLRFEPARETSVEAVLEALSVGGLVDTTGNGERSTPLEVSDERRTTVSGVSADGLGGFWLWAVAGEAGAAAAEHAVRLARAVADL